MVYTAYTVYGQYCYTDCIIFLCLSDINDGYLKSVSSTFRHVISVTGRKFLSIRGVVMVIASCFTVKNNFLVFLPYIMVTVSLRCFLYSLYLRYAHQSGFGYDLLE